MTNATATRYLVTADIRPDSSPFSHRRSVSIYESNASPEEIVAHEQSAIQVKGYYATKVIIFENSPEVSAKAFDGKGSNVSRLGDIKKAGGKEVCNQELTAK